METMIPDFTPKSEDDPKVLKLLGEIRRVGGGIFPNAKPVYVRVSPESGAEAHDCFFVVDAKVERDGGKRILGWTLREESVLMSAEFHAVWESPEGDLLDVTPKGIPGMAVDPVTRILFVSAPEAKYEGKQVRNINLNISGNPLVDDLIVCLQAEFDIMNRGKRAYQYGDMKLGERETKVLMDLRMHGAVALEMTKRGMNKKSPCPCGSGKKYHSCHGKLVDNALKSARKFG